MARSKKDTQGLLLMAGVGVGVVVLFAANFAMSHKPKPDAQNCIAPIESKVVFVIDGSDAIPTQTADEIQHRVIDYVNQQVTPNSLVSIFRVDETSQSNLKPIFSACKPEQTGNELYENAKGIEKAFREHFEKPLKEAIATQPTSSSKSPIGEILTDLSLTSYMDGKKNDLVVFSDLLQNSQNASLYQCNDPKQMIESYKLKRSGAVERPAFKNLAVQLNLIPRAGLAPDIVACRQHFWSWYFGDNAGANAGLVTKDLPG